ncbi:endo-1,4-beta-xylanase [Mobilitalea sibirica]|uniref:Beta-xylanase n=1 Tax=Mobilitalea sibirica TaxID=1462919 RepID=A0A8J7KW12_9FIRM|nr:endo-1,4-beta-xylanase [Mobilitalea sibirica]MBH1940810.1 endo-1,4-beta-xylanase [Mobilitalea sibirica]
MKTLYRFKQKLVFLCFLSLVLPVILTACSKDNTGGSTDNEGNNTVKQETENLDTNNAEDDIQTNPGKEDKEEEDKKEENEAVDYKWPEDFSLYEAYEDDFLLGTIYTDANTKGLDMELTLKHFNAITPENLMKPEYMQPTEGNFHYTQSDKMVQFGQEHGLVLIGHTLAWHSQSGKWLGRNVSREESIEQLRSHITNIVEKYKGQFAAWDVVNEAINDGVRLPADGDWTKCLRQTQWLTSIGPDYLEMAFTFAREADPDLKLYYNDYNLNSKDKADIVYAMVKDFKERGIPIDGIGMQGHYNTQTSIGTVEYSLKKFSELGVEVSITELDITVNDAAPNGLSEEQEKEQAIVYAQLFKLFREYKDMIERVTFWGYVDHRSWRSDRFPCLFNEDFTPKEAVYAVLDPEKYLELNQKPEEEVVVKAAQATYGTPQIDGTIDDIWTNAPKAAVNNQLTAWEGATGNVQLLWDEGFVYVLFDVQDSLLNSQSFNAYEQDSVEIFLDQKNDKTAYYDVDDGQYRVNYEGLSSFGSKPDKAGFKAAAKKTDHGYLVEMAIPLVETAKEGMVMGFDAQINDSNAMGMRQSIAKFNDLTDNSWATTEKWGVLELVK